jgi:hypothetical protein
LTLFEYLAIAFSLVFSFGALRLVSGLPYALDPGRRYPLHVCHVFLMLVITASIFWGFWSFRDVQWDWFLFIAALAGPGILYYLACMLVPDSPSVVTSWRDYFYDIRKQYFLGVCAWFVVLSVNTTVLVGLPLLHPVRATHLLILAAGLAGVASESPRVHVAILVGAWLGLAVAVMLLYLPGSLAA